MSEKMILTRTGLVVVMAVLGAAALATAGLLHFVAEAPPVFVVLITCISSPALIVVLYMGWLLRHEPENTAWLGGVKVLAIASICMGALLILDYVLPTRFISETVVGKIPRPDEYVLDLGTREQPVSGEFYAEIVERDAVKLEVTQLFGRIRSVTGPGRSAAGFTRSSLSRFLIVAAGVLFFLPLPLLRFTPDPRNASRNMQYYVLLICPSYVLSLIATGLLIKLLLVNIQRMM